MARASRHTPATLPQADDGQGGVGVAVDLEQVLAVLQRVELLDALVVHARVHGAAGGGRAVLGVLDAGGQVVAAGHAGMADGADVVLGQLEALVVLQLRAGGAEALQDGELAGVDRVEGLLALGDLLVGEDDHRGLVVLGDVEGLHRDAEGVGHRRGRQHRPDHVAVGGKHRREQVGLLGLGGQPGGGPAPLHVDDHQRAVRRCWPAPSSRS